MKNADRKVLIMNFMHIKRKDKTRGLIKWKPREYKKQFIARIDKFKHIDLQHSPHHVLQRYTKAQTGGRRSLSVVVPTSHAPASFISSSYLKWRPRRASFTGQKKWKSLSAKSGEYGGWSNTMLNMADGVTMLTLGSYDRASWAKYEERRPTRCNN